MRRFNFRLEAVLRMRMHEEREVEHRLAEATGRCVILRRELTALVDRKNETYRARAGELESDVGYRLGRDAFVLGLDRRISRVRDELSRREAELASVQEEYRGARSRRKAMEELRNRREQEHYLSEKREEVRALDEIGATLYVRKRREEV